MLQELWLIKTDWDDPLSSELQDRWASFQHLQQLASQISISRWLGFSNFTSTVEVHRFSDVSRQAMAAMIYTRVFTEDGYFITRLLCSKTKVTPIKRLSIPRLELMAVLLLARLLSHALKAIEFNNASVICWTDSSMALTWITTHPTRWKDFVYNRIATIHELLPMAT